MGELAFFISKQQSSSARLKSFKVCAIKFCYGNWWRFKQLFRVLKNQRSGAFDSLVGKVRPFGRKLIERMRSSGKEFFK